MPTPAVGSNHPELGAFAALAATDASSPLGAHGDFNATTFAVYSKNASRVLLEIYVSAQGEPARFDYWMTRGPDDVFRVTLAGVSHGTLYGFRAFGPNWPFSADWTRGGSAHGFVSDVDASGNRFNPNKLLFDPYARELSHDRASTELGRHGLDAGMFGSGPALYTPPDGLPMRRREVDTGPWAPKAIVVRDHTPTGEKPLFAEKDLIIYEVHPRGLTRHPSSQRLSRIVADIDGFSNVVDVPREFRGTYRGAGYAAKYLKALGVNAVEFLPVHEAASVLSGDQEPESARVASAPFDGTYWGYMSYGYFAPNRSYAHDKSPGGPTREFKQMVKAFHDEGIAVLLDVVYNHSGEGGLWQGDPDTAELLFLRGLDNAEYYALTSDARYYWETSGCGNNLDAGKACVERLILDSLTYWSQEMNVDGFRFDLATVLGRYAETGFAFRGSARLLALIENLAETQHFIAIAEAWDLGGSEVGNFPNGWAEWNGVYRDAVRRFLRGDDGRLREFLDAMNGDYRHFADQGGPHKSVNFLTAHDGFSLMDLVSYQRKNNGEPWPFGASDGGNDDNDSWDSNGDTALRRQRLRNFMTVLMFSRGVPMLRGGDEFAQTLNGNNNPYNLDSVANWHNFDMIGSRAPHDVASGSSDGVYHDNYGIDQNPTPHNGFFRFVVRLLALRRDHACLRQDKFADFELGAGDDVTYLFSKEDGVSGLAGYERCVMLCIDGREIGDVGFTLLINMSSEVVEFTLPRGTDAFERLLDTADWAEPLGNHFAGELPFAAGSRYWVHAQAVAVFRQPKP